jgi:catechol 2,3-dioxygenase-like lactoylglutathione lyase family enzyme
MEKTHTYGLTHLALAVKDLKRTMHFYQQVFDMQVMYDEAGFIQLNTPGCFDVLLFEEKEAAVPGYTGGIAHFGFRLRDPGSITAMRNRIVKAGAMIIDEGEFVKGSPYIFFKDPDGYMIEVWYELIA